DGEEKKNEVRRIHGSRNAECPMTNQRQMTKGRDSLDHYIATSDLRFNRSTIRMAQHDNSLPLWVSGISLVGDSKSQRCWPDTGGCPSPRKRRCKHERAHEPVSAGEVAIP